MDTDLILLIFIIFNLGKTSPVKLTYKKNGNRGCLRIEGKNQELIKNQDFVTVSIKDLTSSLESINVLSFLSIKLLEDSSSVPECDTNVKFLEQLNEMLDSRLQSFKVNEIDLSFRSISLSRHVLSMVVSCQSDMFKSLNIKVTDKNGKRLLDKLFSITDLSKFVEHHQIQALENFVNNELKSYKTGIDYTYKLTFSDEVKLLGQTLERNLKVKNSAPYQTQKSNTEMHLNTQQSILYDMPDLVIDRIVNLLQPKNRLDFRAVCKRFRAAVDRKSSRQRC